MSGTSGSKRRLGWWWLWTGLGILLVSAVLAAVFLPLAVVRWLEGADFRRIASQQLSSLLKTEGELEPLEWSSFNVYSAGFRSRPEAAGPWLWNLQEVRTEISPRLLLDRILRFPEITIDTLTLSPGTRPQALPESVEGALPPKPGSAELFREVQVGKVEVGSFSVKPCPASQGWGAKDLKISLRPAKQSADLEFQGGEISAPLAWVGVLQIVSAKVRYADPTVYLTALDARSSQGGGLQASGEYTPGKVPQARGRINWEKWSLPGGKIGLGLFEIPAKVSGDFVLQELRDGGAVGQGQVNLVEARLEPGKGSETVLGLLAALTGEPRLRGCPLTTARAQWSMQPGIYDIQRIEAEAPGLLRALGQARITGNKVTGQILLGLEKGLGAKVNALTGGECFRREENGYLVEPVSLYGTLDRPQNDLQAKLTAAMARTAVRTGAQILENAAGSQGGDAAKAAGQILNSLFAPPGR